jgi:peptidoglycan/LPS O-acetylase OafA/YrhL
VSEGETDTGSTTVLARDAALDGVRGVAIGLVLLAHGFTVAPLDPVTKFLHTVTNSMQIGLDVFFVLSGFLISSILIRTREDDGYFRNFYARRVLRIFPAYYLVLVGVFLVRPLLLGEPPWHEELQPQSPYFFLYIQNFVLASRGLEIWPGLHHTFSLAIEEQFYLVWPLVFWVTPKRLLLRMSLLFCAGSLAIKCVLYLSGASLLTVYMGTLPRLHALAAGAAVAAWIGIHGGTVPLRWLRMVGVVAGATVALEIVARGLDLISEDLHTFLLNVSAMPFLSWLLFETLVSARKSSLRRVLEARPLLFLGRYSYGLYLIHFVVLWELRPRLVPTWSVIFGLNQALLLTGAIDVLVSVLMAMAMYHAMELPVLKLKRYFVTRRPTAHAAAELRA